MKRRFSNFFAAVLWIACCTLIGLTFAVALRGEPSPINLGVSAGTSDQLFIATSVTVKEPVVRNGKVEHDSSVNVKLCELSETGIVLECSAFIPNVFLYTNADPKPNRHWREYFVIRCGRLVFDHLTEGKVVPATEEHVEWPK